MNYYRFTSLKQHRLIILYFHRSKIQLIQLVLLLLVSHGQNHGVGFTVLAGLGSLVQAPLENLPPGLVRLLAESSPI